MATRSNRLEERLVALERAVESLKEELKLVREEVKSGGEARGAVDVAVDERVGRVEEQVGELASVVETCRIRQVEYDREWPALEGNEGVGEPGGDDGFTTVVGRKKRRVGNGSRVSGSGAMASVSFAEKLKRTQRKVTVVGDSLARGVGFKLREHSGSMVEVQAVRGAKLGAVADKVGELQHDDSRQLVVIAGANSLHEESAGDMMASLETIIDGGKRTSKDVVMVGFVKRYDLGRVYEGKRISMNARLRKLCEEKQVSFVEYEPGRGKMHPDGLHLNYRGQHELGKKLFSFIRTFLL